LNNLQTPILRIMRNQIIAMSSSDLVKQYLKEKRYMHHSNLEITKPLVIHRIGDINTTLKTDKRDISIIFGIKSCYKQP